MPSSVSFFSPRSSSPAFHIFLNTPVCTHHWNLSCTVVPAPKLRGSALHWHPVRSTYKMAVIAFLSSIGGRPPFVRFLCRGSSGMTRAHTVSEMQNFSSIPIVWSTIFPSQRIKSTSFYHLFLFSDRLLDALHHVLLTVERAVLQQARAHDPLALRLIRSVPGIGKILSLVILYEVQDISRFSSAGNFISYSRLVKCPRESAGKKSGARNSKIGNVHLKWAFSEAAVTFLRDNEPAQHLHQKLLSKYGKAKALSIIAQKLGRTIYFMLKHKEAFDPIRFFQDG
jgi:hypothetical protein